MENLNEYHPSDQSSSGSDCEVQEFLVGGSNEGLDTARELFLQSLMVSDSEGASVYNPNNANNPYIAAAIAGGGDGPSSMGLPQLSLEKMMERDDEAPFHSLDNDTRDKLQALLQAAGIGTKLSCAHPSTIPDLTAAKALSDPTILKRLAGTGNAPGMLGLDEMMPPPNACHTMPNGTGGMPLPMPGVGDNNPLLRVQPGYEGSPADPASESSTGGERNGNIYEGSGEDGDSLLSLACVAGYYDLVQALLAMNSNVEDRGIKNDSTPLMEAAFAGHVEIVKLLLAHKAQVNAQSSTGSTALMHACSGGHEEVVRVLLDHGSSVTLHNDNGHTPLMEAASAGHVDIAKLLVEYGASLHSHSSDFKESPLTLACYKGHLDMVKYLLEMGGDPDHRADEMHTALMEASMDGHVEVARLLLDCGAEVNMPADSFESPLTLAACGGHTELAKLLLERGANIEEVNDEGYTPLMEAAREGHEEMVALLLSYNADVNAQTEETGETALTLACCSGFPDVASLLIRAGANLEQGANSPLMEAAQEGHLNCLKLLLLEGAKVNAVAVTNDTALTYAAENGHTDCCTALVDSGAFFDSAAEGGRTALMKAARAGHERTVAYLISAGADVNRTTTNNEHTALSLAAAYGFLPCVQLLLANGADPNHKLKDNSTALIEAAKGGHTAVVKLLLDFPGIQVPTNISGQLNQLCQGQFEQKMIAQLMQGDYSALEQNITVNNEIAESVVSEPFVASLYADIMQQLKTANEKAPSPVKGGVATDLDPGSRSAESAELLKRSILSLANQHEEATAGLDLGPEFGSPDGAALQNLKKTLQKKVGDLTSSEVLKLQEILKQQFHKAATVAAHQSIDSSTAQVKQPQPEELKMPVDVNRHKLAQAPEELPWDVAQAQLQQLLSKRPVIDSGLAEYAASALAPMASWNVPTSSANAGTVDNSSQSKLQADMVKLLEYASQMVDPRKAQQEFTSPSKVQQQWDVMPQLSFDPTPADPSSPSKPKPLDSVPPFGSLNVKDARLPQNLQALNLATTTTIVGGTATQERQPVAMPPPSQPGAPVTRTVAVTKGTSTTTDGTPLNNDTSSLLPTTATTQAAPTDSISRGALPVQPTPASGSDDNTVAATPAVTAVNKKNHPALDLHTESNHDTALTLACAGGHEELVTLLLNRGSNIEHKDKKGFTPLMLAATAGHSAVVEALLTANPAANIEQTSDRTKDTALSLACSGGRKEVVDVLLRKSANIEHRNVSDYTPLSLAASGGYVEIIQALIGSGAEINSRTGSKLGISPLMLAAMNGHTQAVKLLLEKGADINAQIETNRNTALTLACFQGRHEVVRLLLEYHANVEHRAKTGLTPLMEAASGGYTEVGKVLVEYGADVNAAPVPSSRDTALTIAADKGHMKFVELLVKNGSQLDVKNKKGNTPLWLAAHGGFMDVMQVMVKACAQVDAYDNRKITPLMAAFRKGHLKAVKYLVKHVSQFPSDSECMRFINTIDDKDLDARCHDCMKVIMTAKDRQAQEAAKNAKSLLQEIEQEQQLAETRRQAKQKKQEKKRQKRNAKKIVDSHMGDDFNLPNEKENLVKRAPIAVLEKEGPISGDSSDVSKCSSPEPQPAPPPLNNRVPPSTSSRVLPKKEPVDRSVSPEPVRVPAVPAVPDVTPLRSLSSTDLKTKSRKALQNSARQNTSGVKSYGMSSGAKGEKSIRQSEKAPTVQTMIFEATSHRLKVSPKSPGMMNSGIGDDGWSNARNRKSAQHKQSKLRGSGGAHQQSSSGSGTQNSSSSDNVHGAVVANKKLMQQQAKDLSIERIESRRNYRCEKIQVSSTVIARVIGRQGNNINAIRETTGAHIEVEKQARGQSHRQITLRGPNDAIKQAIAMINGLIDDQDAPVQEIIANVETTYSSASSGQGSSATQKTAAQPERAVAKRLAVGTNAAPAVANKENNSLMAQKFPNISMWSVQKAASTANRPVPTSNAQQREPTANRFPELERTTAPAQQQSEYRPFGGGFGVWGGDGSNKDPGAAKPQVRNFAAVVTKNMSSAGQAYQQQQQATVIQTTQASMTPLDVPNGPLSAASAVGPNLTAAETAGRLKPTSQQQGGGMSTTQQLGDHMTPNFSPAIVPPTRTSPQTASQDLSPHDEFGLEESKLGNASPYAGIKIYESSNQSDVARRGQTTPPPSQGNQNLITPGSVDKQSSGSSTGGYNAGGRISASPLGMINEDNRATLHHQHSQQQQQHQQQAQSTFFSAVSLPRPASATPNLERSSEWNVQDISANIANLSYNMNHAQHQQQSSSMSTSVNNHQQQQPVSTYVPPLYSGQQRSFMSSQQQVTSHDDMRGAPPQQQQTGPIMSTGSASHTNPYDTYLNQVFHSQPPPGPPPGNVPPPPQHHFSGGHSSAGFHSNDYNQGPPPGPPMGHLQQQQFTMQPPPTISQHQQSHSQQRDFSSEWGAPSQHQQSAQQFYSPNQFMDTPFTMRQHERQTQNAFAPQQRSFTNMLGLDSDGIMNAFDPALTDFLGSASSHSGPPGAHSAFFAQPPPEPPSGKGIMGALGPPNPTGQPQGTHQQQPNNNTWNTVLGFNRGMVGPYSGTAQGFGIPDGSSNFGTGAAMGGMNSSTYGFAQQHQQIQGLTTPQQKYLGTESNEQLWKSWQDSN